MNKVNAPGCPLCAGRRSAPIDRVGVKLTEELANVLETAGWCQCLDCGLLYNSKVYLDKVARKYYDGSYRDPDYPNAHDIEKVKGRAERQVALMEDVFKFPAPTVVLDYGCAMGYLLEALRDKYGCEVYGTEYSSLDRQKAAERGLHIAVDLDGLPKQDYDLICLSHVLEHMPEPVPFLRQLREMCKGRLFVEVPSPHSFSAWQDFHTVLFTTDTLPAMLDAGGWKVTGLAEAPDKTLLWAGAGV